ncbi:MAG: hypothetical protein IT376_05175 [Polyangiaceae bacterium]|nr:hypothetical protein [Polyangiaceae bacterium]
MTGSTGTAPASVEVEDGVEVVGALRRLAGAREAWLAARGVLVDAELRIEGEEGARRVAVRGRATLASFGGPAEGPWTVVLARATATGVQVTGGELVRARSGGVVVTVLPLGATPASELAAGELEDTPLSDDAPDARPAASAGPRAAPAAPTSRWGAAALESAAQAGPAPADVPPPARGDYVNHFAFGLCEVLRAHGGRLDIRDARGTGRVREIALELLEVAPPTERNGRRTYRLSKRG